jgi:hypothetical protein
MPESYTVSGTLSNQTTVILDEPISLPAGRVRITVEPWPTPAFWSRPSVAELAASQGVKPVANLADLAADFWPEQEPVDDFIETIYAWRRAAKAESPWPALSDASRDTF